MPLKNISDLEDELDNGIQLKFEMDTCSWNDFRRQHLSFNPTNSEIDNCVEILAGNINLSNFKDIQPDLLNRPFDPTTGADLRRAPRCRYFTQQEGSILIDSLWVQCC